MSSDARVQQRRWRGRDWRKHPQRNWRALHKRRDSSAEAKRTVESGAACRLSSSLDRVMRVRERSDREEEYATALIAGAVGPFPWSARGPSGPAKHLCAWMAPPERLPLPPRPPCQPAVRLRTKRSELSLLIENGRHSTDLALRAQREFAALTPWKPCCPRRFVRAFAVDQSLSAGSRHLTCVLSLHARQKRQVSSLMRCRSSLRVG